MAEASQERIMPAGPEHLDGMARCHIACFPGQFMSEMGRRFVKDHYRAFLACPQGLAWVAASGDGEVLGLVAGGPHGISRDFLRRATKRYFGRMLWKAVTNSAVRAALWQRVFSRGGRQEKEEDIVRCGEGPPPGPQTGYIQTICVLQHCRGSGMAGRLLANFTEACRDKGFTRLALAVSSDNGPAIAFYARNGWRTFKQSPVTMHMCLDLAGPEAARDAEVPT